MITKEEYALLSAAVYNDARGDPNKLDVSSLGWATIASEGGSTGGVLSSGLSINAYKKGNEIVIACKGTDFLLGTNNPQTYSDLIADFGLGGSLGFSSSQLFQAALFYQRVKEQNPGATMTFAGHSLGAGLASILSVWFDKPAIIFADAPFEFTALNPLVQAYVASYLALNGYVDSAFTSFISTAPFIYSAREAQVTGYYVKDEVLNNWLGALYFVVGDNKEIDVGGTDLLSPVTLHSIVLHASLLITEQLRQDTFALPHLLARMFDEALYAFKLESKNQDFLTQLLKAQIPLVGGDMTSGPLTHFAEDMRKLGAGIDGSSPEAQDALIAQSIEWYFHKGATPSAQSFFTQTGNLLQYTPIQGTDLAGMQSKAAHYVDPWLDLISTVHGILRKDVKYEQWNVVSGTESATAVAKDSSKTQIFIGGAGGDTLIGGNKADIFYAGEGNDSVDGGAGNDILAGGTGNDIYQFTGTFDFDTIVDNDGWGSIQVDGNPLQGGRKVEGLDNVWRNEEQGYTFALAGSGADRSLLIVKDGSLDAIRVKGWQDGQLGLTMDSSPAPSITIQHIYHGDQRAPLTGGSYDWSSTHWAADGTLVGGVVEENFFDVILGTLDRDRINGLGGKDVLQGWLGDDEIDGGEGDDLIAGGPGRDFILGGAGDDIIMGAGSFYYLDYNPYSYSSVQAWNPLFGINALAQVQFDPVGTNQWVNGAQTWIDLSSPDPDVIAAGAGDDTVFGSSYDDLVAGDAGDDVLWGMEGNDVLAGGTGSDVLVGDVDDVDYALSQAQGSDLPPVIYGNDFLDGGDGNDVLLGGGAGDALFGGGGNDVLAGDGSSKLFLDGSYINRLVSQDLQGDDFLDGGDGDDTLIGAGGNDVLIGGAGADTLDGGRGNDSFSAGAGDTVTDSQGIDALVLADGQPASVTADGADLLLGYGNSGTLRIVDALRGSMEVIDGLRASDWLNAYLNDAVHVASIVEGQSLSGGSGDDILASSHENVRLSGRTGNDSYILGNAGATVDELANEGTDTVRSTVSHSLAENVENLALTGTASVNGTGNDWDNVITGNAAANVLAGGAGKDTLNGGDGDDSVYGESGDDVLYASHGNDTLAGGDGLDTYVLGYGADRNTVMDDSAEGSIIKLGSAGIKFEDLSAVRRDDDLVVEVRGTSAAMRIKDYYASTQTSWVFEDAQGNTVTGEALVEASRTDWTQLQANLLKDFQSSALGSISRGYADGGYAQRLDGSWYLAANYAMGIAKTYDVRTEWSKDVHTPLNDPGHPWVTTSSYVSYAEWATQQWGQETARDWTATTTFQPNTVAGGTGTIQSYTYATSTENAWSAVQWTADSGTHSESEWAYESSAGWPVEHPTEAINHYTRYDIDSVYYEGTVGPLTFQEPGAAAQAGNLPDYVAVDFLHQQFDYNLGPSLLADGDQTVWADQYSAVIGGIGNNTIYDAGFAYGGTGNAQLIGGGTLMAGTGDQYLERGDTMVVGDGHDTVVGHDSSRILVNPHNLGIDLIGQDFDWESDIDYRGQSYEIEAIYRAMGYEDWKKNYQYGGKFRLDFGEDFEGYFDSLEDARAAFVPSDAWPSFDDAMAYPYTTWRYIEPLTALYETPYTSVEDPASGLAASSYYAAHGITATMLAAKDFSALRPLLDAELLPKGIVSFGPGLSLADLTLSWGEAVAPLDGVTHTTLDILWGVDQGIRIMMPQAGDALNSVVQQFEFADGTVSTLQDLVAMVPLVPELDFHVGSFRIYVGTAGADMLAGTTGFDIFLGGAGDDLYLVDSWRDVVGEEFNEGFDTVVSTVDHTIRAHIETLVLTGTALNGTGNALGNTLIGNRGANQLAGGFGADTLIGGDEDDLLDGVTGDDASTVWMTVMGDSSAVYYVYGSPTVSLTIEDGLVPCVMAGGSLRFEGGIGSSANIYVTPGSHVDIGNVDINVGSVHLSGKFSDYSQTVDQNTGIYSFSRELPEGQSERLDIKVFGVDSPLYFSDGYFALNSNDSRVVSVSGDMNSWEWNMNPWESNMNSWDWSMNSWDWWGYENWHFSQETRVFEPIQEAWLTAGEQAWPVDIPVLTQGADRLVGGLGNDLYFVDEAGDVVVEDAEEGTDTVQSYLPSYTLGANVENLTLLGNRNTNGTGNTLANVLSGNAGNNILAGGHGGDTYQADRGMGQDRIVEDDATSGINDVLSFGADISHGQLWFRHLGNDLEVSIIGTADKATMQNWYLGSRYHVEQIKTDDGKLLLDSDVESLVQAMAAYTPPAMGQMDLSAAYAAALAPVMGSAWH